MQEIRGMPVETPDPRMTNSVGDVDVGADAGVDTDVDVDSDVDLVDWTVSLTGF